MTHEQFEAMLASLQSRSKHLGRETKEYTSGVCLEHSGSIEGKRWVLSLWVGSSGRKSVVYHLDGEYAIVPISRSIRINGVPTPFAA